MRSLFIAVSIPGFTGGIKIDTTEMARACENGTIRSPVVDEKSNAIVMLLVTVVVRFFDYDDEHEHERMNWSAKEVRKNRKSLVSVRKLP
jgi:hypothetical protein